MPYNVQMVRGTTEETSAQVGLEGQLIVDLGLMSIRVHDGATVGGFVLLGAANNLSELTNAETARTNLGLGTAATHASGDFDAAGAAAAVQALALLLANNLSDLANVTTALSNLGIVVGSNTSVGGSITIAGVVIKWGQDNTINITEEIDFPVAFPTNCVVGLAVCNAGAANACGVVITDKTKMTLYKANTNNAYWIAIGY